MTSLIQIRYGSRSSRHGNGRAERTNQSISRRRAADDRGGRCLLAESFNGIERIGSVSVWTRPTNLYIGRSLTLRVECIPGKKAARLGESSYSGDRMGSCA